MDNVSAKNASDFVYRVCVEAEKRIKETFGRNEKPQIVPLSKELSSFFNEKDNTLYHILKLFLSSHSDYEVKRGPGGGIVPKKIKQ